MSVGEDAGAVGLVRTCLDDLHAALMREDMPARLSASCFARWGFICISSAMVEG